MDPALEVIISSMLKVMYISYTKLLIRHNIIIDYEIYQSRKDEGKFVLL